LTNAWLLATVSAELQVETLPYQQAWGTDVARSNGWTIMRTFSGVGTGKHGPRRLVRELLAALRAEAEPPQWLLMVRLDRIGRDALECQIALRDIHALGVRVWTREGGEEKGDTAMERFVSTVRLYLAEQENEVRRDKALAVYKRKRAAGQAIGNKRPYGLTFGPDGRYAVDDERARVVREIFRLRLAGHGLQQPSGRDETTA
jgi:DNA invertase Pin-like site-specific DNA recombinase